MDDVKEIDVRELYDVIVEDINEQNEQVYFKKSIQKMDSEIGKNHAIKIVCYVLSGTIMAVAVFFMNSCVLT